MKHLPNPIHLNDTRKLTMALFDIELTVEWYVVVHTTNISHSLMFVVDIHDYAEYFDSHESIENFTISTFE